MYRVFENIEDFNTFTENGQKLTSGDLYIITDDKKVILQTNNIDGEFAVYDMIEPTGNIEITENGEDIDVAQYASATVNVAGSGGNEDLINIIERDITTFNIPNGTTKIGYRAFSGCDNLTSITIPNSVTSIEESAISGCIYLPSITIPNSVTSIGKQAFYQCYRLTSIIIPDSVTSIGIRAFNACSGLTSVTIGSGVTNIDEGVFGGCTLLESVTINATTPPTLSNVNAFNNTINSIYVPAASVDAYKAATNWNRLSSRIQAIPTE